MYNVYGNERNVLCWLLVLGVYMFRYEMKEKYFG